VTTESLEFEVGARHAASPQGCRQAKYGEEGVGGSAGKFGEAGLRG
jgi:hypothetical protein